MPKGKGTYGTTRGRPPKRGLSRSPEAYASRKPGAKRPAMLLLKKLAKFKDVNRGIKAKKKFDRAAGKLKSVTRKATPSLGKKRTTGLKKTSRGVRFKKF